MKFAPHIVCLLALPLALAACEGEKKPANKGGTAQGEILPGSASDAMLPYDTVRSQPPLAPPPTEAAKSGAKERGGAAAPKDEAADEGPAEETAEEAAAPEAAE